MGFTPPEGQMDAETCVNIYVEGWQMVTAAFSSWKCALKSLRHVINPHAAPIAVDLLSMLEREEKNKPSRYAPDSSGIFFAQHT